MASDFVGNATMAYNAGDDRACFVFLKRTELVDEASVSLLVNCMFRMWKTASMSREGNKDVLLEQALDTVNKGYSMILGMPKVKLYLVKPFDYTRLAHIYVCEGSIDGASKIIKLASLNGYLEDRLVVFMRWAICKQQGDNTEAEGTMDYLCSSMLLLDRLPPSEDGVVKLANSDLNVVHVYMHCAAHMLEALSNQFTGKLLSYNQESFDFFLGEAYRLSHNGSDTSKAGRLYWFNEYDTWYLVATKLEETSFALIAEESYMECFLQDPILSEPLMRLVECLKRRKADDRVYDVVSKALDLYPLNLFGRRVLAEIESQPSFGRRNTWTTLFRHQDRLVIKLQSLSRSFLVRKRWPQLKNRLQKEINDFAEGSRKALLRELQRNRELRRNVFVEWKEVAFSSKSNRYSFASKIQTQVRRAHAVRRYMSAQQRIARSNRFFLILAQSHYNSERYRIFRFWHQIAESKRRDTAAAVIQSVLDSSIASKRYERRKKLLILSASVHHKFVSTWVWQLWLRRYLKRRTTRSIAIIRQTVRAYLLRKNHGHARTMYNSKSGNSRGGVDKFDSKLISGGFRNRNGSKPVSRSGSHKPQSRTTSISVNTKSSLSSRNSSNVPHGSGSVAGSSGDDFDPDSFNSHVIDTLVRACLTRKWWTQWRKLQQLVNERRARDKVAVGLSRLLARVRGRAALSAMRVRLEGQHACLLIIWRRRVVDVFRRWRGLFVKNNFQRMVEAVISRLKWRESETHKQRLEKLKERIIRRVKRTMFTCFKKSCDLSRWNRNAASGTITAFFRKITTGIKVENVIIRKSGIVGMLFKLHEIMLRRSFAKFLGEAHSSRRKEAARSLMRHLQKDFLHLQFRRLHIHAIEQVQLTKLRRLLVFHPMSKKFGGPFCQDLGFMRDEEQSEVRAKAMWEKERILAEFQQRHGHLPNSRRGSSHSRRQSRHKIELAKLSWNSQNPSLLSPEGILTQRALSAWRISFSMKSSSRQGSIQSLSVRAVLSVVEAVKERQRAAMRVQCWIRARIAHQRARRQLIKARRLCEMDFLLRAKMRLAKFRLCVAIARERRRARLVLQRFASCVFRRHRASLKANRLAALYAVAHERHASSLDSDRGRLQTCMKKMLYLFCVSKVRMLYNTSEGSDRASSSFKCLDSRVKGSKLKLRSPIDATIDDYCLPSNSLPYSTQKRSTSISYIDNPYDIQQTAVSALVSNRDPRPKRRKKPAEILMSSTGEYSIGPPSGASSHGGSSGVYDGRGGRLSPRGTVKLRALTRDFESIEYHATCFRLRDTGIFLLDTANVKLTRAEVERCLAEADVVLCCRPCERAIEDICEHFKGSKLTLVGGRISSRDISLLAEYLKKRSAPDFTLDVSDITFEEGDIVFQFIRNLILSVPDGLGQRLSGSDAVGSQLQGRLVGHSSSDPADSHLPAPATIPAVNIAEGRAPTHQHLQGLPALRKLSIDSRSLGTVATCVLIAAMQHNATIEELCVELDPVSMPMSCLADSIRQMSINGRLKVLRITGCDLPADALKALCGAFEKGLLRSLNTVDVLVASDNKSHQLRKQLIEAARVRGRVEVNGQPNCDELDARLGLHICPDEPQEQSLLNHW